MLTFPFPFWRLFLGLAGGGAALPVVARVDRTLPAALHQLETEALFEWDGVIPELVRDLPPASYPDWGHQLRDTHTPAAAEMMPVLLVYWARQDGPAALAFAAADNTNERIPLISHALMGWAGVEPEKVWAKLRTFSSNFTDLRFDIVTVHAAIADRNLELALAMYAEIPSDRYCLNCMAESMGKIALNQGRLKMIRLHYTSMPEGVHRDAMRDVYWFLVGKFDTYAGKRAIADVSVDDRLAVRDNFLRGWSTYNFSAALDFAVALGDAESEAVVPVIGGWARGATAGEVGEIIAQLPDSLSDRSLTGVAELLGRVNPAATAEWCGNFRSDTLREEALTSVMRTWSRTDPTQALNFVHHTASDTDLKGSLLWSYLFARLDNHSLTLEDMDELDGNFRNGWVEYVFGRIAARLANPNSRAVSFLPPEAFQRYVRGRSDLTTGQQGTILSPFDS